MNKRSNFSRVISQVSTTLIFCSLVFMQVCAAQNVNIIAHGWDTLAVTPEQVLQNADQFNCLPIDGVILNIGAQTKDGKQLSHKIIPYGERWKFEYFEDQIPVLRKIVEQPSLRHSFAGAWIGNTWKSNDIANRKRWDDDRAWSIFANNMGVLARIVREAGLEGIVIDNEDYSKIRQYFWQEKDGDYELVRKLARRRGREVFGAAFREKPDLKIMAFWFLSMPVAGDYLNSDDPDAMRKKAGDLWPDFVNGMLDVMPDTARFIDGNETTYYDRAERDDSFRKAKKMLNNVLPLVEPENRVAYRGKMMFAPAHYLDSYIFKDTTSEFYMPPIEGGTRFDRFAENFRQTVASSDGYIWLYGERYSFIKWRGVANKRCTGKTWSEMLPGFYETIGAFNNPGKCGSSKLDEWSKSGKMPQNLISNGSCAIAGISNSSGGFLTNRFATGFSTWKMPKTPGEMGTDASVGRSDTFSVRLENVKRGCLIVSYGNLKLGERYAIRAFAKGRNPRGSVDFGNGYPLFRFAFDENEVDGWRAGYCYIVVPKGAKQMRMMLGGVEGETLWYDDIGVYADKSE